MLKDDKILCLTPRSQLRAPSFLQVTGQKAQLELRKRSFFSWFQHVGLELFSLSVSVMCASSLKHSASFLRYILENATKWDAQGYAHVQGSQFFSLPR